MDRIRAINTRVQERYYALSSTARIVLWCWVILQWALVGLFIYVTPSRIFEALANWAEELRDAKGGFVLLVLLITVTSFPPLFGYTTAVTLCGFAFGIGYGFLLALAGTLCGAIASFSLARLVFSKYAKKMLEGQPTFRALGNAVQHKGLPLICLIRLCPLPYSYSNFFFASIPTVSLPQFFIATCALSPKLLLGVFIGNRLYLFSDPDHRDKMDSTSKLLNSFSVAAAVLLGLGVGTYVYRLTMGYVAEDIAGGEVALLEDDLENFLDEEDRLLQQQEEGYTVDAARERQSDNVEDSSETAPWEASFNDSDTDEQAAGSNAAKR